MGYRTTDKLPYIKESPDNSGFFEEYFGATAKMIGYKLEQIVRLPKMRVLFALEDGTVDFYPMFAFDEERSKYAVWCKNGIQQRDIAISKSTPKELHTERDIKGLTEIRALGNPDYLPSFNKNYTLKFPLQNWMWNGR